MRLKVTAMMHTSLSAFSLFKASMAAISRMDSSTFPCSPGARSATVAYGVCHIVLTEGFDLLSSSLDSQLDLGYFSHLQAVS